MLEFRTRGLFDNEKKWKGKKHFTFAFYTRTIPPPSVIRIWWILNFIIFHWREIFWNLFKNEMTECNRFYFLFKIQVCKLISPQPATSVDLQKEWAATSNQKTISGDTFENYIMGLGCVCQRLWFEKTNKHSLAFSSCCWWPSMGWNLPLFGPKGQPGTSGKPGLVL